MSFREYLSEGKFNKNYLKEIQFKGMDTAEYALESLRTRNRFIEGKSYAFHISHFYSIIYIYDKELVELFETKLDVTYKKLIEREG